MLQLKDLQVGDQIVIPYYDDEVCIVDNTDPEDEHQPVHVVWKDGSDTWPEQTYVCENTVKL